MKVLLSAAAVALISITATAQTTIALWDFNSVVNDATTSTGATTPLTGAGTIALIGGTTATFASGNSNDPNTTDNSRWNTTTYPAQGTNPKTAGIQIQVNTVGQSNIYLECWQRLSNTSSNTWVLQYTLDHTAGSPVWIDAQQYTFTPQPTGTGDTWYFRSFDFSAITGLNNNPNAAFRIVSDYDPVAGQYVASRSTSSYSASGTSGFDLVKVSTLPPPTVNFSAATTIVNEDSATVQLALNLTNHNHSPSIVKFHILGQSTAQNSIDFTTPITLTFPGNTDTTMHLVIGLNNDALAEKTEYAAIQVLDSSNVIIGSSGHTMLYIKDNDYTAPAGNPTIQLEVLGTYTVSGSGNSAEISAFDPTVNRLYTVNSVGAKIEILDLSDPRNISLVQTVDISAYGNINSIAVYNGIVAAAIENSDPIQPGYVVFFDSAGNYVHQVTVGVLPDMICFTPDHTKLLTANEGQPDPTYATDPEGSVSIVDISNGVLNATVTTATFTAFNTQQASLEAAGVRIFGPGSTVAQDLEPEYITVDSASATAWITLQENNAIAKLDITTATITDIYPLGYKDHSLPENAMDISNTSGQVLIANWPVRGLYMPDAIASFNMGNGTYLVTANEGDAREYTALTENIRIGGAYTLDSATFGPFASVLKHNNNAGRLYTTTTSGDIDNDNDFDQIYAFGSRSFTIWDASGNLVWDSGDQLEQITAADTTYNSIFNCSNDNITLKNRSDDKGPEPEGVAIGMINDTAYTFIALERIGGIMAYNITDVHNPQFVQYINNRSTTTATGDLGPEGIIFVDDWHSPVDTALIIVSNEISGTVTVYKINHPFLPGPDANFTSANTTLCPGDSVTFTDQSTNNPTSWQWTFAGGIPAASTLQHPTVVYPSSGTYAVQLVASSLYGTDTLHLTSYITVNSTPAAPVITQINDSTLQSSVPTGNQWNDTNGPIAGATGATFEPSINGLYSVTYTDANGCTVTTAPFTFINTTGVEETGELPFSIYPNPAADYIWFSRPMAVELHDITGKELLKTGVISMLDMNGFVSGVYLLETKEGQVYRIIKR